MAAANLAICVWQQPAVTQAIGQLCNIYRGDLGFQWTVIERVAFSVLSQLRLPKILQNEVEYVYRPVGKQILHWMNKIDQLFREARSEPTPFISLLPISDWPIVWTPCGMLNEQASAKWFLDNSKLDLLFRYRLACTCCCEEHIVLLWEQMSQAQKTVILDDLGSDARFFQVLHSQVIPKSVPRKFFEYLHLLGLQRAIYPETSLSMEVIAFSGVVRSLLPVFKPASVYLFNKLSADERVMVIDFILEYYEHKSNVCVQFLIYILSLVDAGTQLRILVCHGYKVMKHISVDWQWRHSYESMVTWLQKFVSGKAYVQLLAQPWLKLGSNDAVDEKYKLTLRRLWKSSPIHLKKYVLAHGWNLFAKLLKVRDALSLKCMFSGFSATEMETFATSPATIKVCLGLAKKGQVGLIDTLMHVIYSSEAEVTKLKECLVPLSDLINVTAAAAAKGNFSAVDSFLNWRFSSEEKYKFINLMLLRDEGIIMFLNILSLNNVKLIRLHWFRKEEDFFSFQKAVLKFSWQESYYVDVTSVFVCLAILDDKKLGNIGGPNFNHLVNIFCEHQITDLRLELSMKTSISEKICSNLFECDDLPLAAAFLNWLFPSKEDHAMFMKEFFLSFNVISRILHFIEVLRKEMTLLKFDPWQVLKMFLNWFQPTTKMIVELKAILESEIECIFFDNDFFKVLNDGKFLINEGYCNEDVIDIFFKRLDDPNFLIDEALPVNAIERICLPCGPLENAIACSNVLTPFIRLFSLGERTCENVLLRFSSAGAGHSYSSSSDEPVNSDDDCYYKYIEHSEDGDPDVTPAFSSSVHSSSDDDDEFP